MNKLSMSEEEMLKRKYTRPYEKRIAELEKENADLQKSYEELYNSMRVIKDQRNMFEKENAELKLKLEALEGQTPWKDIKDKSELIKENAELKKELKTAYRKGMRHMAKALKDYDRTDGAWTDYFEHTVDKVLQREQSVFEEYGTLADQLTKAKELLKKYVIWCGTATPIKSPLQIEAEQFLSEVEK